MSTFTYQLRVKHSEGALVRILGLTRRRRYDVVQLLAYPSPDGDFMDVQMTVRSKRAAPVLARQLEKLLDVSHVQIVDGEPSTYLQTKAASL
ncbi:MAG: ACT domain-containing protein [Candidatus Acidiferrales bacterium]